MSVSTTSGWRLRAGAHAAVVHEDLVLLDVITDNYLCLAEAGGAVRVCGDRLSIRDPDLAQDLRRAGLLEAPGAGAESRAPLPSAPARTALPDVVEAFRPRDAAVMAWLLLDAARCYRARSLADLLRTVRASRPGPPRSDPEALLGFARDFHRWIPYAPLPAKCLLRSFILLRLLHCQGLDASWVFGVATWPFRAHCWLQAGDMALDDHPERLRAFTPIMAV